MARMNKIPGNNTTISEINGYTTVILHQTAVVKWNKDEIILNSGGWRTVTTKARMNQTANQFGLGFSVYQDHGEWWLATNNGTLARPFWDGMKIDRTTGKVKDNY